MGMIMLPSVEDDRASDLESLLKAMTGDSKLESEDVEETDMHNPGRLETVFSCSYDEMELLVLVIPEAGSDRLPTEMGT